MDSNIYLLDKNIYLLDNNIHLLDNNIHLLDNIIHLLDNNIYFCIGYCLTFVVGTNFCVDSSDGFEAVGNVKVFVPQEAVGYSAAEQSCTDLNAILSEPKTSELLSYLNCELFCLKI